MTRALAALLASVLAALAALGAASHPRDVDHRGSHAHACSDSACGTASCGSSLTPVFCFDNDNPPSPEMMAWVQQLHDDGTDYQLHSNLWGPLGSELTLTWSLVPDGTSLPGPGSSQPSQMFSRMNQLFGGNQAAWIALVEQSFDRWSELSGVTLVRVTHGGNEWDDGAPVPNSGATSSRGQIRLGMRSIDGSGGVLAFAYLPPGGDIVMDVAENWGHSSNNRRFFRNTLMHEIGHSLGLRHCCPNNGTKLLNPGLSTSFDGPQHDDVRGVHRMFGDAYTPNHSTVLATDLGTLQANQTFTPSTAPAPGFAFSSLTSIDRAGENDVFRITVNDPLDLNVTVTPIGHTYAVAPQAQSGACTSPSNTNSLTAAALAVQVYGPNTLILRGTAASNPAGSPESLSVTLDQPGDYFVRVYATSISDVQLYNVQISGEAPSVCPTFTLHPVSTSVCLGAPLILTAEATGSPAPTYQWRRNGNPITGATSSTLEITSANQFTAGEFDVVVTNSCGSVTSDPATVTLGPPIITEDPQNEVVPLGGQASFTADAVGSPPPEFRWTRDGNPISGGTDGTLVISSVTAGDAGTYRAEAFNSCGSNFSETATLTVDGACYADCDGNGTLNINDFLCFIDAFATQAPYADCDNNGTFNINDFLCFIDEFALGCP